MSKEIDEQQNSSIDKFTEVCSCVDSTSSNVNKDMLQLKTNNISATNHNFLQSLSPDNYSARSSEDEISTGKPEN